MKQAMRRERTRRNALRNLLTGKNQEIGLLNSEKENLVNAVRDLTSLSFKDVLSSEFARNPRHIRTKDLNTNVQILEILKMHNLDPIAILTATEKPRMSDEDIVKEQEEFVFEDVMMITTATPEYTTQADAEHVEDTLDQNRYTEILDQDYQPDSSASFLDTKSYMRDDFNQEYSDNATYEEDNEENENMKNDAQDKTDYSYGDYEDESG